MKTMKTKEKGAGSLPHDVQRDIGQIHAGLAGQGRKIAPTAMERISWTASPRVGYLHLVAGEANVPPLPRLLAES